MEQDEGLISFDEQVEWFRHHGVTVEDEEKAKEFLRDKNYFYKLKKLKTYYHNFPDIIDDFDQLIDLSTIDMELRYILLDLCLDIEHATKTLILKVCTEDKNEDGFEVVENVLKNDWNPERLKKLIFSSVTKSNGVISNPWKQYENHLPIWVVMELGSFGMLRGFLIYLKKKNPEDEKLRFLNVSFKYVRMLRNYCAHNRQLINNSYFGEYEKFPHALITSIGHDGFKIEDLKNKLEFLFVVTLKTHKEICSQKSHHHQMDNLSDWIQRCQRNFDEYYAGNPIGLQLEYLKKILDIFS